LEAGGWPTGERILRYHRRMSKQPTVQMLASLALSAIGVAALAQGQPPQSQQPPAAPPQYSATLNVGDQAPEFKLPGSDGKTHSLSDYKGKTLVLAWFPKAFTGG
jgi:cytochrome oxidase Cu insertion factor (SCO1/SenC/PrrC family)